VAFAVGVRLALRLGGLALAWRHVVSLKVPALSGQRRIDLARRNVVEPRMEVGQATEDAAADFEDRRTLALADQRVERRGWQADGGGQRFQRV
jgi:hypothetical protein